MLASKPVIVRRYEFSDLLKRPIEVDGIILDACVDVGVRQIGNDSVEVDYIFCQDIYIGTPGEGADSLMKLDQESFKTKHRNLYQRFLATCEHMAREMSDDVSEEKWNVTEDFE